MGCHRCLTIQTHVHTQMSTTQADLKRLAASHALICTTLHEEPQSVFRSRGHEAPGFEGKIFKCGSRTCVPMPELPNRILTNQQALQAAQLFPQLAG